MRSSLDLRVIFSLIFGSRSWSHPKSESGKLVSPASVCVCVWVCVWMSVFCLSLLWWHRWIGAERPHVFRDPLFCIHFEVAGRALVYWDAIRTVIFYIGKSLTLVVTQCHEFSLDLRYKLRFTDRFLPVFKETARPALWVASNISLILFLFSLCSVTVKTSPAAVHPWSHV